MADLKTKPNGIYFLEVRVPDGKGGLKRQRVSCDTRDKDEAVAQRIAWLAGEHPKHPSMGAVVAPKGREPERRSSGRVPPPGGMTMDRWLMECLDTIWRKPKGVDDPEGCKSWRSSQSTATVLRRYLDKDTLLVDVDTPYLAKVRDRLTEAGYRPGTIKRKMMALSAALTEAVRVTHEEEAGLLTSRPPMPKLVVAKNTQDRVISRVEEKAILEAIDARREKDPSRPWFLFKAFYIIAVDMGFRAGELLTLGPASIREKQWLDPTTGQMHRGTYLGIDRYVAKNDKPRDVPCTDRVVAMFDALNAMASGGRWFPWKKGGSGAWYLWNNIRDDLAERGFDLSKVKLHTFRHTCATRLAEGGLDLVSLRDWLGHSDIKITAERYVHLMPTHLHRGAVVLNGGLAPTVPSQPQTDNKGESRDHPVSGSNRATNGTPIPGTSPLTH